MSRSHAGSRPKGARGKSPLDPEVRRRVEELSILYELMKETTSLTGIEPLLEKMVKLIARVLEVEIVSVMLLDEPTGTLHIQAASGLDQEIVDGTAVPVGEGISGHVALTGEPVLVEDLEADARFRASSFAAQYQTGSAICAPLRVKDRITGVLNVNNKISGEAFTQEDLRLLTTIAGQAALAIENARLYEAVRRKGEELESLVEQKTRELQERHQEVLRLKEFNEGVLQNIGSGVMTLDRQGQVTFLNRAGAEILGRSPEETVRRSLREVVDEETFLGIVSSAFEEKAYRKREMTVPRPDGYEVPVGFSTFRMTGSGGQLEGAIILFRDLTDINELKRMDRLASLGVMSAGIAHEVKNPLTSIRFGLEFLKDEVSGEGQDELAIISKNLERVDEIVNSLLRFSRPRKTEFAERNLNQIVRATLGLVKKQCEGRQIEVRTELADELPLLHGDEHQVQQVILNVCLNAIQAMAEEGGLLQVRTSETQRKVGERRGSFVQVEISDTGPGVAEESQDFLFHPFYTTRSEGTGLGLSISHRIVLDHGGYIEVRNNTERGATFTVGFPTRVARSAGVR